VGKPPPIQSFPPFFITSHHFLIAWPWIINASLKQNWNKISAADAKDPAKYRAAKDAAAKAGLMLVIERNGAADREYGLCGVCSVQPTLRGLGSACSGGCGWGDEQKVETTIKTTLDKIQLPQNLLIGFPIQRAFNKVFELLVC